MRQSRRWAQRGKAKDEKEEYIMKTRAVLGTAVLAALLMGAALSAHADEDRIRPYENNPTYWQYKGEPVLLLGGSNQDNLFNHPNLGPDGLEAHLDLLVSVGGNYVRNTMSSRDRVHPDSDFHNDDNRYAFHLDEETGLYDLNRFDDEFWQRFRDFLEMTAERDIIVQIEIWDRWDYGPDTYGVAWSGHPFNPDNNINYTREQTGLPEEGTHDYPIFRTVPELDDIPVVLAYQEAYVEELLSISLQYDHVLYCISNETTSPEEWSRHWARFVHAQAEQAGVGVEVTEMWNHWDLTNPMHRRTFDYPELYSFADTSQNTHQVEQTHWDNMLEARQLIADPPRPMNNVKIYGGERHGGGTEEGTHKLWRNILGGCAASRFHRPALNDSGVGLSEMAQTHLRSARMFTSEFDVFTVEPRNDLLTEREPNEAYCAAHPGEAYAVYFTDGGSVELDLTDANGAFRVRWLNILDSEWTDETEVQAGGSIELMPPGDGQWLAVLLSE